eukprot:CAMPEP_0180294038 /NCGR_PEP_ID=MMETSP0988-20121125/17930_1 /TAXON_ID=697907 /ORGANISM="non described non described, Strain CCMP2293" /LENGTH=95 /DNA_ID=CAMNT_0022270879 /DNA_START=274 /DNA_END=560 /DNA_ORIENTATION=+
MALAIAYRRVVCLIAEGLLPEAHNRRKQNTQPASNVTPASWRTLDRVRQKGPSSLEPFCPKVDELEPFCPEDDVGAVETSWMELRVMTVLSTDDT